jgi:serine/threonine-protein phosphatase 2A regulatory subunit B'
LPHHTIGRSLNLILDFLREAERAIARYDEWMRLREIAIQNAGGYDSPRLPASLREPPPPRPEPYEDNGDDVGEVSAEMLVNGTMEGGESFNLERSMAEDVVPLADPGLDRSPVSMSSQPF